MDFMENFDLSNIKNKIDYTGLFDEKLENSRKNINMQCCNPVDSFCYWKELADKGDVDVQYKTGRCYY